MTRPATAVVILTNCDSADRNGKLALLQTVLEVAVLGPCGTTPDERCDQRHALCFQTLGASYLFYVALEVRHADCHSVYWTCRLLTHLLHCRTQIALIT